MRKLWTRYLHNCANYGTIIFNGTQSTKTLKIGGILGVSFNGNAFIDNCVSAGKIESEIQATNNYIGSIVGYATNSATTTITHCLWTSDVRYNTVYGYKESSSSVITMSNNSLTELNITTLNELNSYAKKNSTWSKWFMLHLNEGIINNDINQGTLIVTQKYFPDPVKEGSTFSFWCTNTECTEKYDPEITDITGISNLYALWDTYTVTLDFGNGTKTLKNVTYGEKYGALPEVGKREGYSFVGWFTEEDEKREEVTEDTLVSNGYGILYAHWTINNYTLTFIFNNSECDEVRTLNYSDPIIGYPENPVREGYTFNCWDNKGITTMPAHNLIVTALWTPNNYTVTFNATGGDASEYEKNVTYDDVYGDLPEAEKEGYTFVGWFTEEDGNEIKITEDTIVEIDEDHTLYAYWTINNYTLTFIFNNSQSDEVRTINYNENIDYPDDPVKEGYTFNGWDNKDITMMPAHNLNITAQWAINNYTLTFIFNNGESDEVRTLNYSDVIEYPDDPVREGFTFNGWSSKPKTMPAHSLNITAQWVKTKETTSSEFVEIVFGRKDLSEEEVKAIISEFTEEEFVIEKFEVDSATGEIRVIIRFVDSSDAAAEFVRNVNERASPENFIKEIGVKEDYKSHSNILHPSFLSSLFIF